MTTIIFIFVLACVLALLITPLVIKLGLRLNIVDVPSARKVHDKPIPRIGGLAIFLAFFFSALPLLFPGVVEKTRLLEMVLGEYRLVYVGIGSCIAFGLGVFDDNRGLGPGVKFGVQTFAALVAFAGGVQIHVMSLPGFGGIDFGLLSLPVTVFWILLVINAINLIDGLDGLAAGVSFFVCMILLVLCIIGEKYLVAVLLSALAGALLGFLRYNFNPARIFMGDGGSYFLGYMLACLSIMGAIKGQTALAILIPVIALGVPLIDTAWATIRRFVLGQNMFRPDREHFHHRLLKKGLTHRNAVLVLYGVTMIFGGMALLLVNAQDERAGLILAAVGVFVIFGIRRLGYFEFVGRERVFRWLRDLHDEAGLSWERRSFLHNQMRINSAATVEEMWEALIVTLRQLDFDHAALYMNNGWAVNDVGLESTSSEELSVNPSPNAGGVPEGADLRQTTVLQASVSLRKNPPEFVWSQNGVSADCCGRCPLRIEMELAPGRGINFGTLLLLKDINRSGMGHYTLKRVEHLRRGIISTLLKIHSTEKN